MALTNMSDVILPPGLSPNNYRESLQVMFSLPPYFQPHMIASILYPTRSYWLLLSRDLSPLFEHTEFKCHL
jgi:hypothetical protein